MPNSPDHLPGDGLAPWYVVDGAQRGPLPESTLAEWIRAGLVSGSALVWRHGLAAWEPISRHFASAGARTDIAAEDPSQPARDGKQRSEPSPASRWVPLLAAGLIAALFYDQRVELSRSLPPAWIAAAWAGAVLASLGFGILAAVKWWQYAAQQARGSRVPHLWGILKLACAMLGICLVVGEAIAGYVGTQVYRVAVARQIYNHYTMKVAGDDLVIKGEIGPGFASSMDGILRHQSGIHRIEITSPGGLVDEGLGAAKVIEARPDLTVVARKQCASMCIVVLLAGSKTYADWDLKLLFHAVGTIIPRHDDGADAVMSFTSKEVESFLTNHRVPGYIIANMDRAGPQSYEPIPAILLAQLKVLTGLLDGDKPLTLRQAKWLWVEGVVARRTGAPKPIAALYEAIDAEAGFVSDRHVDDLYDTTQESYFYRFNMLGAMMMDELLSSAVQSADDKALSSYIAGVHGELDQLAATTDWRHCRNLLDDAIFVGTWTPEKLATDSGALVTALLRSANQSGWKAPAPEGDAELAGRELRKNARMLLAAEGILIPDGDRSARGRCLLAREAYDLLAAAPVENARTALGWLGRYSRL